jgi:hypothetical protein
MKYLTWGFLFSLEIPLDSAMMEIEKRTTGVPFKTGGGVSCECFG